MGNSTGYRCDKKKEGENLKEEGERKERGNFPI